MVFTIVVNGETIEWVITETHSCLSNFHHGLIAFNIVKIKVTQDGFMKKHIHVCQNFHHGLATFNIVKIKVTQDGFMKKHIHVCLTLIMD